MDDTEPISLEEAQPPKQRSGRATLTVVGGPGLGTVYRVEGPEAVMGRGVDADLTIGGDGASRLHAKIVTATDGRATLIDLGSTNGTHLNGLPVVAEPLRDNDRIQLGRTVALVFRYEYEEAGKAAADDEQSDSMDGVYETIAATLENLARMYETKGDLQRSLETHERSLSLHQAKLGTHHPSVLEIGRSVDRLRQRIELGG